MLKYLSILILSTVACCNTKVQRPNPSDPSLKPTIKQITETTHDPVRGENEVDRQLTISKNSFINTSTFDPNGLPESKSRFNSSGNLEWKIIYKYDRLKRNTETVTYGANSQLVQKKVNTFDSSGNLLETREADALGRITAKEIRIDTINLVIRRGYQVSNGRLLKTSERTFDTLGNNILTRYFLNGALIQQDSNVFADSGNRIETTESHPAKRLEIITRCQYDKNGNPLEVLVVKNSIVISRTVSKYDSLNNILGAEVYGITGQVWTSKKFMYQFDQPGNWTEQVIMQNGMPSRVIVRNIIYY